MADITASGGAGARNCKFLWDLDFDDAADTVKITATHTHFDDSPAPDPQVAQITVILNSSVDITVDCLTGRILNAQGGQGAAFSQASPGVMINAGPKTRTGVRLRVSATRAQLIEFTTQYTPPA